MATPEQPPIFDVTESPHVPAQEAGKLRRNRDCPAGAFGAVFEADNCVVLVRQPVRSGTPRALLAG